MFTAIRIALGPHAKNLGTAVVAGAGFTIGASLVGIASAGLGRAFTKASEVIDTQVKKSRNKPVSYAQTAP
jgi:hypothetical protein